ncbi:hypothetical protein UPYG_G00055150 [Umbra pygmaea]|uniref:C2H2-type domain-containing protein n=1 Tax=Umbra pygmaea TaxID=75934 RepID=A0ABD0XBV5_UMBPY
MDLLSSEKESLIDEIEQSLFTLTEENLRYLCKCHGQDGTDDSRIKGMNHRLLRRKILEEMWDNMESRKSGEQGLSWLLHLKRDIRSIQEDSGDLTSSRQPDDNSGDGEEEDDEEDMDWLPSTGLGTARVSPSQTDEEETADDDWVGEDTDWLRSNGLEVDRAQGIPTSDHSDQSPQPTSGRDSTGRILLPSKKRDSVQLVDCAGQSDHLRSKTTDSKKCPCSSPASQDVIKTDVCRKKTVSNHFELKVHLGRCYTKQEKMNPLSSEKEVLIDEIEQRLFTLTEDNLRYLCGRCEKDGKDGCEIKEMNHRLLRRKIMKEMWENTDSEKSEEQGMLWLLQLKHDIIRLLEGGSSASVSPSQANVDADHVVEEWVRCPSNGLRAKTAPVRHAAEHNDKTTWPPSSPPMSRGCVAPASPLFKGLKRLSVRLVDCRKMLRQTDRLILKTTPRGEGPHSSSNAEQHNRPGSHICDHCGKDFTTAIKLQLHISFVVQKRYNGITRRTTRARHWVPFACTKNLSRALNVGRSSRPKPF